MEIRLTNHIAGAMSSAKRDPIVKKQDKMEVSIPQDKVVHSEQQDSKMDKLENLAKGKESWHGNIGGEIFLALAKVAAGGVLGLAAGAVGGVYACAAGGPVAATVGGILGGIVGGAAGTFAAYKIVTR